MSRAPGIRALWRSGLERLSGFGRPIGLAWVAGAALALPASVPVYEAFDRELARSRYAPLAAQGFDLDWFMDFKSGAGATLAAMNTPLLLAAAVALLLSVFFAGGVLGQLRDPVRPVRISLFLHHGATHFGRFLRLFLMAGLTYAAVFWFVRIQLSERLEDAMRWFPSDTAVLVLRLVLTAVVLWLMAWIHMAQDLARLAAVVEGRRDMVAGFFRGFVNAARNFEVLAGLYVWALVGWAGLSGVYLIVAWLAGGVPGAWGSAVLLTLAQLYMLARTWVGFGLTASLLTWYEGEGSRPAGGASQAAGG